MISRTVFSETRGTQPACFYTCQWSITPQAKETIDLRLTVALDKEDHSARLSYDYDKQMFKIDRFIADTAYVYSVFEDVLNQFLKEQLGEIPDFGEQDSNLASRIVPLFFRKNESEITSASEDFLIEGFLKTEWSCARIEQLVDGVFHQKLLRKIGDLTECTLSYHSETRKITIIGPFQEACHKAILKLDKVRDYDVPIFTNPFLNQSHCFWAEEHEEFVLIPVPLKSVHTLYETTLLDISKYPANVNCYHDLSKGGKLRCGLYDQSRRAHRPTPMRQPEPAVKDAKREEKFRVFRDHKYAAKGEEADDPMNRVKLYQHRFPASKALGVPFEITAGIEGWVQGVNEVAELTFADPVLNEKLLASALKTFETNQVPGDNRLDLKIAPRDATSSGNAQGLVNYIDHCRHLARITSRKNTGPQNKSLLDGDIVDDLPLTFQPLSLSSPPIKPLTAPGRTHVTTPTENLQTNAEPDTRSFYHTMGQKAAKGQWVGNTFVRAPLPPDVTAAFLASIHTSTAATLATLRGYRGSISLRAIFGRIWITRFDHRQYPTDPRHMPWTDEDALRRKLVELDNRRPIVDMTDLLTTEPADTQFLLDMSLFGGENGAFWNRKPQWEVSYEFQCYDPSPFKRTDVDAQFMVTVDAENFTYKVHSLPKSLGETYVHCLKRVWDFRISATGTADLKEKYGDVAAELVKTLYIPPNTDDNTLTLSFSLPPDHALSFPTVRVAKKCTYTIDAVTLHITEMRDLCVERLAVPPGEDAVYRACARGSGGGSHQEVRWFEVSVSSKVGDEMAKANESLEVGGEVRWGASEWKEPVEGMVRTACEVVKGMEGVGGWNGNPFGEVLRAEERRKGGEGKGKGRGGGVKGK